MSVLSIALTMLRIREAPVNSKIAVFESNIAGCLRSVFDSTITTQQEICRHSDTYVGSFDRTDDDMFLHKLFRNRVKKL